MSKHTTVTMPGQDAQIRLSIEDHIHREEVEYTLIVEAFIVWYGT